MPKGTRVCLLQVYFFVLPKHINFNIKPYAFAFQHTHKHFMDIAAMIQRCSSKGAMGYIDITHCKAFFNGFFAC